MMLGKCLGGLQDRRDICKDDDRELINCKLGSSGRSLGLVGNREEGEGIAISYV